MHLVRRKIGTLPDRGHDFLLRRHRNSHFFAAKDRRLRGGADVGVRDRYHTLLLSNIPLFTFISDDPPPSLHALQHHSVLSWLDRPSRQYYLAHHRNAVAGCPGDVLVQRRHSLGRTDLGRPVSFHCLSFDNLHELKYQSSDRRHVYVSLDHLCLRCGCNCF